MDKTIDEVLQDERFKDLDLALEFKAALKWYEVKGGGKELTGPRFESWLVRALVLPTPKPLDAEATLKRIGELKARRKQAEQFRKWDEQGK